MTTPDIVSSIMDYESGHLSDAATVELFAQLVRSGHAWSLQGHYGRMASALIDGGYITSGGRITDHALSTIDGWPSVVVVDDDETRTTVQ